MHFPFLHRHPSQSDPSLYDLPPGREEHRVEILTPPDMVNLHSNGRPSITSISLPTAIKNGLVVPTVTMGA